MLSHGNLNCICSDTEVLFIKSRDNYNVTFVKKIWSNLSRSWELALKGLFLYASKVL